MLLDEDDAISNVPPHAQGFDDEPTPRVAVVYRSRGVPLFLIPPLLLVAALIGVVAYRGVEPRRPQVVYVEAPKSIEPDRPAQIELESSKAEALDVSQGTPNKESVVEFVGPPNELKVSDPIIAMVEAPDPPMPPPNPTAPTPEVEPVPAPAGAPASEVIEPPVQPPVRDAVGFDPEALKSGGMSTPDVEPPQPEAQPAPVVRSEVPDFEPPMDDIQREAKRIALERRRLAMMKRSLGRANPALDRRLREERVLLARRESEAKRQPFLDELRQILSDTSLRTGEEIEALCKRSGRETAPELLDAAFGELSGPASRFSLKGKVQRLRAWGVPEPIILDHLIDTESGNLNGRSGPKGESALLVRAARILLSIPLTSTATSRSPAARPESSPSS